MAKFLHFRHHGERYVVNEAGEIKRPDVMDAFSGKWLLRGFSTHHMQTRPTISLAEAFADPKRVDGAFVHDNDHGTDRIWGGRYHGRLPRVEAPHVREESS